MDKTYSTKKQDIKVSWHLIDAKDKVLGRIATKAASILRGKHKVIYTPHLDCGDGVIIVNAARVKVTGKKRQQNVYGRYSGYPGGLRQVLLDEMLKRKPKTVIRLAIRRMLPQGPLGRDIIKKLKVYVDDVHPHKGQNPITLTI